MLRENQHLCLPGAIANYAYAVWRTRRTVDWRLVGSRSLAEFTLTLSVFKFLQRRPECIEISCFLECYETVEVDIEIDGPSKSALSVQARYNVLAKFNPLTVEADMFDRQS